MKYILTLLLVIPLLGKAQADSAKRKVSVIIQARDLEYIATFTAADQRYEDIDSVMKQRFRVSNPPTGTTNVQVDSVQVRDLLALFERLRSDHIGQDQGVFSRYKTALTNAGNNWLTLRIDRSDAAFQDMQQSLRQAGRARLRKERSDD